MTRAAALLLVLALAACARLAGLPGDPGRVTLLQLNDVYTLEPVDEGRRGGFARLATLVRRLRADSPHTLFALAGDTLSPSPASAALRGEHMIAGLNALGLDMATFGNHEFDFGPAVLRERMAASRFLWVSSNVRERASGAPFGGAASEVLRRLGPVTVGVFGLTTTETARSSNPGPAVEFVEPLAAARQAVGGLRTRGATIVVALTHQHMADDRRLAATVPGIDVVLGGHEHEPLVAEEGRTLVTKAGSDARYLVQVDLWVGAAGSVVERSWTFHDVSARLPPAPDLTALVEGYARRLARELDAIVGRTTVALEARRAPLRTGETNTGDFVADAMREATGADAALVNGGGLRGDRIVAAGPLARKDVHALLPFGNVVVTLEVTGRALAAALEQGLAGVEREGGGFFQVSGIRLVWDSARPAGRRIVEAAVAGAPLDPGRAYRVAVVDYVARGGDGITALREARVIVGPESGPLVADVVLRAIEARGTIAPAVDGRIRAIAR